jgi:hypothetical protein
MVNGFDLSISDENASQVEPAGIAITYQRLGSPKSPPVLLIMGISGSIDSLARRILSRARLRELFSGPPAITRDQVIQQMWFAPRR